MQQDASVGQQLLELKYRSVHGSKTGNMSRKKKYWFIAFSVLWPWITKRIHLINGVLNDTLITPKVALS